VMTDRDIGRRYIRRHCCCVERKCHRGDSRWGPYASVEEESKGFEVESDCDFVRSSFLERELGVLLAWLMKSPS